MFTKTQTSSDRLNAWRKFRKEFSSEQINDVLQEFSKIRTLPRYLDYYTPNSWPSVFEIIDEGYFCQSGITLIIAATLINLGFISTEKLRFDAISNHITGADGLVLVHKGMCYNFIRDKIVSEEYMLENSTRFNSHVITTDKLTG